MNALSLRTPLAALVLLACDPAPEPPAPPPAAPQAAPLRLLPLAPGDLAPPALAPDAPPAAALDRGPVALSWPIDQDADDLAAAPPPPHESRAWWRRVDPAALAAGVPLPLSRPGALLKLSPAGGAPLDLADLELEAPGGARHRGDAGLRRLADPVHLRDAGMPFGEGTAIFEVRPELGAGEFTLRAPADAPVLVYVLERDSGASLSLAPRSDVVFVGAELRLSARLREDGAPLAASAISGDLLAPDGTLLPLALTPGPDGAYAGVVTAPARAVPGVLYTLQVRSEATTRGGLKVRRDATSAVSLVTPTARFTAGAAREQGEGALRIDLDVEVAAASRFGASAVLYASTRAGELQPLGVAQSAAWLEPGARTLSLTFDRDTLGASTLGAPYELRDLRLTDQGRLSVLHRQARALPLD